MIAANELRIGNWVMYDNRLFQIEAISRSLPCLNTDEFGIGVVDWNNINPIPLTPEILEKCGFVKPSKNDNHGGLLVSIGNDVSIRLKPLISGEGYYWDNFNGAYKVIINHLHQLQNLYFALTNSELTINL